MKLAPESIISGTALIVLSCYLFSLKNQIDSIENRLETKALKTQFDFIENRLETKIGSFEKNLKQLEIKHADISTAVDTLKRGEGTGLAESRKLTPEEKSPFNCEEGLCTAENKLFLFPKGVIIGAINAYCQYGEAVLSVDVAGGNCPSGSGSVTFGSSNVARSEGSSVTGGLKNTADGEYSSVSGGYSNSASEVYSSVSGGFDNSATGNSSSVSGGSGNTAYGDSSSMSGGSRNIATGEDSSVSGGYDNTASGESSSVSGGWENFASGFSSSVTGGKSNSADGALSSVSAGRENSATGIYSSVNGGEESSANGNSSSVLGGENNVAIKDFETVWKNVCKDNITAKFSSGKSTSTCKKLSKKPNKDKICKRPSRNPSLESASDLCPITCNTCDV